jgi:nucleotide sugar dehydrogenase|tara:strand:+ start:221 stop:1012 length:792 start_codon:yes stop_codon:yes gene_type:complete
MKLGIIGKGFVGSAVSNGFNDDVEQFVVDPLHSNNSIEGLVEFDPIITFVCVPTPVSEDGSCDVSIARSVLQELNELQYKGVVVIKSTIVPDYLHEFKKAYALRIVYNPEFLTEANANQDFINPKMQVLGGRWKDCEVVEKAYLRNSKVKVVPTFKTDLTTASLLKYTINSFLATKVMFFNDLYKLHQSSSSMASWEQFIDMLTRDPRMGDSHMQVPGPDGKFGFGGHCFPKDTEAMLKYANDKNIKLNILKKSVETNNKLRE